MASKNVLIFYLLSFSFAAGILARSFFNLSLADIAFIALISLVVAFLGRGRNGVPAAPALFLISVTLFGFAVGAFRMEWATYSQQNPNLESRLEQTITFEGKVVREPVYRATAIHLYVETANGLILVITELGQDWQYGDRVEGSGVLKKPEAFETELGRIFNYEGYLWAQGVSYTIFRAEVTRLNSPTEFNFLGKIFILKRSFMANIERLLPEPQAGLGEGLLLGVKKALGEDLETTFRRTGIIHIVVLSGYNMAIVSGFILLVLGMILGRRVSAVVGIAGIILFAIMVGLSATVVRAAIMGVLILIMGLTGRIYVVLRGLVLAGVIMLLWNPYSLAFDVGFQLSFLATLGLILVAPQLLEKLESVPTIAGAREFLVATLATQLFVLPLLLYQIGEFSVVAVIVNVLVLPMVPIAMLLTFLTGLMGFISTAAALPMAYLTHLSLSYIIEVAEWFGALPFAAFTVPTFPFWLVPLGYALIGYALWRLNQEPDPLSGWVIEEEG